jgi:hypothetical protein
MRRASGSSYWRHSHQSAAFEAPANTRRHRIPLRQPHSLHGYSCPLRKQSRWLDARVHAHQVCPKLPLRHSFQRPWRADLQGRIQKRPVTHPGRVSADSAPSLFSFTVKGLMPLSSLSFSRSAFWAEPRRLSVSGPSVSPSRGSRRQRALNEPFEPFTRLAIVDLVRVPPGDLRCSLHTAHPLWTRPTCRISAAGVSRSPLLLRSSAWDRISGLLSGWSPEDYSEKPPSNWTTHSRGNPALRDTNVTVGKLRPLSRMVSSV